MTAPLAAAAAPVTGSVLPSGTVTFLLTDVEGSTRLWEQHPDAMRAALRRHDALVERTVGQHGGVVVRPRGEGDSRFAVFARATDAVAAAAAVQQALHEHAWPEETPLRVRVALHTGEADLRDGDYYGTAVNRCARLRAVAHGGQAILSQTTYELVQDVLPGDVGLLELGKHRLSDLVRPEPVYQVLASDLPRVFPPLKSLEALPTNLPVQRGRIIGRAKDVAAVCAHLRRSEVGVVTLTGPGGVGKTRLALHVASELLGNYPGGVWLADLSGVADLALVLPAVAEAVGVPETRPEAGPRHTGQSGLRALADRLRWRRLLLVLDNCEQVIGACARVVEALLRVCPHVRVLATSREPLGTAGEIVWRVPALALPPASVRPGPVPSGPLVARLRRYAAVQLFVDRAAAALPSFSLTAHNAAAVAELCRRLDGLPLAIELAAARARTLSPQQIAARLDDRLGLLTGGTRTAPARQQTLRAAADWSYELLSEPEQTLFRRLAVLGGAWTLEAADAVCGGGGLGPDAVLDLLARLVDKSLVEATPTRGGDTRYRLLETLREYALVWLDRSGERGQIEARLGAYSQARAEQKVLRDFLDGARLKAIPASRTKRVAVLKWLAGRFEPGEAYPEAAVNERLKQHHPDFATLRRELVAHRFMSREGGVYRRATDAALAAESERARQRLAAGGHRAALPFPSAGQAPDAARRPHGAADAAVAPVPRG
jgi:predicted ATPase/class 3 adenylate cyclase